MKKLKIRKTQIGKCFETKEDYIVYKKVNGSTSHMINNQIYGIAILLIPKGSKIVVSSRYEFNNYDKPHAVKLRTNIAICMGIIPFNDATDEYLEFDSKYKFRSMHNKKFNYKVGKILKPTKEFDASIWSMCRRGIHFLEKFESAEKY